MAVIEVYADIWCPFTHVGLRTVVRRRSELGRGDVAIRVRSWPLELVNNSPLDVDTTAAHVEELQERVAPNLFAGFDPNHFPRTTLPALALASAAFRKDNRAGEAVSLALRDALFEEGRDISRPDVLNDVAQIYGVSDVGAIDEAEVLADWHQGESRGVKGSPHFFCGEVDAFCPSLTITKDEVGQVHIERSVEALDIFLGECFESG
jgi:predicted DsbA family dithiol-disulfide isomerase